MLTSKIIKTSFQWWMKTSEYHALLNHTQLCYSCSSCAVLLGGAQGQTALIFPVPIKSSWGNHSLTKTWDPLCLNSNSCRHWIWTERHVPHTTPKARFCIQLRQWAMGSQAVGHSHQCNIFQYFKVCPSSLHHDWLILTTCVSKSLPPAADPTHSQTCSIY